MQIKHTIGHIISVLDWLQARGVPQWKQQRVYEALLRRRSAAGFSW